MPHEPTSQSYLLCAIGDSRTFGAGASVGYDPVSLLGNRLREKYPKSTFQVNNQAINGTTSQYWLHAGLLPPALTAFRNSAADLPGETELYVQIMLGVNDASGFGFGRIALESYLEYMRGLIIAIVNADLPGFSGIVMHTSYYAVPYRFAPEIDEQCINEVRRFNAALPSLTNGRTVFMGDQAAFAYFEHHPDLMFDGLHASNEGNTDLAVLWEKAYEPIFNRVREPRAIHPHIMPSMLIRR